MNVLDLSTNQQYPNKKPIINMSSWMRNQLAKQCLWQQHKMHLQKDCRAYMKLLLYCITGWCWWRIWKMDDRDWRTSWKKKAEEEEAKEQQQEEDIDLTPHGHERALKRAYRSCAVPGTPKIDTDSYFDQTKPHIKTLIEDQLKEMQSAKIIMTL